jgi:hypothetical protein
MYQMVLHHGSDYITRKLIADGVEPFGRTGKWSLRTVKKILRSCAVLGHLESKHGIIEDVFDRIPGLAPELWLQAQAAQDRRRDAGSASPWESQRVNLLVGIGQCAYCQGKMRLTTNDKTHLSYYGCRKRALLGTCENRSRYRQDIIEAALLDRFGLGWLEAKPAKAAPDVKSLETQVVKLRDREKRLAGRLKELDTDDLFDTVMGQLRELRSQVSDAATRLQAARQEAALAHQTVRVKDLTDLAHIATALKQQLISAQFGPDNVVVLEGNRHILTVQARADGDPPKLALKVRRDGPVPKPLIRLSPSQPVQIKTLVVRRRPPT